MSSVCSIVGHSHTMTSQIIYSHAGYTCITQFEAWFLVWPPLLRTACAAIFLLLSSLEPRPLPASILYDILPIMQYKMAGSGSGYVRLSSATYPVLLQCNFCIIRISLHAHSYSMYIWFAVSRYSLTLCTWISWCVRCLPFSYIASECFLLFPVFPLQEVLSFQRTAHTFLQVFLCKCVTL